MNEPPEELDAQTRRRKTFGRFLLAHMLAYVPAFVWAVAWIPIAIITRFAELERMATDESVVKRFILHQMIAPVLVVGLLAHVVAIPWIRRPDKARLGRFLVLEGLLTLVGVATAIVFWIKLLAGR